MTEIEDLSFSKKEEEVVDIQPKWIKDLLSFIENSPKSDKQTIENKADISKFVSKGPILCSIEQFTKKISTPVKEQFKEKRDSDLTLAYDNLSVLLLNFLILLGSPINLRSK